jgi:uncharacterized protein YycO
MKLIYSRSHTIGGVLIRAAQWWAPWTHCGIVTPLATVINARPLLGVVEEPLEDYTERSSEFVIVDVETPHDDMGVAFARFQVGKGYDYGAIVRFISSSFRDQDEQRFHCAELVETALFAAGRNRFRIPFYRVTPNQSYMTI